MSGTQGPPPPYSGSDHSYPLSPNPSYGVDPKMAGAYGPPPGAYPGQPGYGQPQGYGQPGYQGSQTTMVVTQPMVTLVQPYRESPVRTRCPHCQAEITTATCYKTGNFTWIFCLTLSLIGCSLGCCLIPFCVDRYKDVIHSCPNCRQQLAHWKRT